MERTFLLFKNRVVLCFEVKDVIMDLQLFIWNGIFFSYLYYCTFKTTFCTLVLKIWNQAFVHMHYFYTSFLPSLITINNIRTKFQSKNCPIFSSVSLNGLRLKHTLGSSTDKWTWVKDVYALCIFVIPTRFHRAMFTYFVIYDYWII